jgi:hypothetical protein
MATFIKKVTGTENAIEGLAEEGRGLVGKSVKDYGVRAHSDHIAGIKASSNESRGVEGWAKVSEGVVGVSISGNGVWGQTEGAGIGVLGTSNTGSGVAGRSQKATGVRGDSTSGRGVEGWSTSNYGVTGDSQMFPGVRGTSVEGRGIEGWSTNSDGVFGISTNKNGVSAVGGHTGIYAKGELNAGFFDGNVWVSKTLTVGVDIVLANADCAEDFDIVGLEKVEPGTVMVIGQEGSLRQSDQAYDKRVAGVISGAGKYKPGIVLDKQESSRNRMPIALMGKVYCKVDASYGAIEVGDLLTTSPTLGHAMKTDDPLKAFGTVIGKALRPLEAGQGLIPILIALQ